ncbi:hypothetical protein Sjap_002771 [Stephania japonica]|uniref:Uncharacterized protein n=1 Tax=Stephania japonica TaxID=461633 RepID=A0AAP0PWF5_9MAGN
MGTDDEYKELGEVDPIPILDNENEVEVEFAEEGVYEHIGDEGETMDAEQKGDEILVKTPLVGDKGNNRVDSMFEDAKKESHHSKNEHAQNKPDVFSTLPWEHHQANNHPISSMFLDELKATVENLLSCIENFLISLDGEVRQMHDAFSKTGGDVSTGLRMVKMDMDCLLKRANDVAKKAESSSHIMNKFVIRMDPMVDECERVLYGRSIRKQWKRKTYPKISTMTMTSMEHTIHELLSCEGARSLCPCHWITYNAWTCPIPGCGVCGGATTTLLGPTNLACNATTALLWIDD